MARATLSRRLLTLATGLVVGMASAFAGATTATAAQSHAGFPFDGIFQPVCDGTHVTLIGMPETAWTVEAGEQQFWPIGDESGEVALG